MTSKPVTTKNSKEAQVLAKSRIDDRAQIIEPIDFSFKEIISINEFKEVDPRFPENNEPKKVDGKYCSMGLKLGYNALDDLTGLYERCTMIFAYPKQIYSLDISFNCLTTVPQELLHFEGLKCLYLHANRISDITEVDKLKGLKNLTTLTLHGNPIENLPGFKHYILAKLPKLRNLNFSGVSNGDRQTATTFVKTNKMVTIMISKNPNDQHANKRKKKDTD